MAANTIVRVSDRLLTLSRYVQDWSHAEVEDVTCENFMTEYEGTHTVLLRGVAYDWDSSEQTFAPRQR